MVMTTEGAVVAREQVRGAAPEVKQVVGSVARMLRFLILLSMFSGCVMPLENLNKSDEGAKEAVQAMSLVDGWGLPDGVAVAGKFFHYQLPLKDSSGGNFTGYQVKVVDTKDGSLKPWLCFDNESLTLDGVPRTEDVGQIKNFRVTANCIRDLAGGETSTVPIEEYFTIKVLEKDEADTGSSNDASTPLRMTSSSSAATKPVRCRADAAITMATVIIDVDEGSISGCMRACLVRSICAHLGLPVGAVRLSPLREKERAMFDDNSLVAGPGNVKHPVHSGVLVQWDVGCGNVFAEHMPVLELLEVSASNGLMAREIGYGVAGWHITSKRPPNPRRLKRYAGFGNPTATPIPSEVRPSRRPGPTVTITDTDVPETRVVPTTASSTWEMEPTKTRSSPWAPHPETSSTKSVWLTKSPTPTTTYVTITPTRVLSTVASTVVASPTPGVIDPSVTPDVSARPRPTEIQPSWTTDASTLVYPTPATPSVRSTTQRSTKRSPKPSKSPPPTTQTTQTNKPPVVLKPLGAIEVVVGSPLFFQIPLDTFADDEDIENLAFVLLGEDGLTVDPFSWLKFNETSRTLYGLPLEDHEGTYRYQLVARDGHGKMTRTPFNVTVVANPASHEVSHELSVTLDMDYDQVMYDVETRLNLINKIAAAYGDKDASKMRITRISRGSVVITWTNSSLPSDPCPQKEIEALLRVLLQPNGEINETFARAMEPYRVMKAEGELQGSCADLEEPEVVSKPEEPVKTAATMPAKPTKPTAGPMTPTEKDVNAKPAVQKSDNQLLYILLPVLIGVLLLILLIVVCCVCYKRQRRRQKEQDKLNGLHKGIPIIFADELEEKPETPASTLKSRRSPEDDEKQSVPPPEYPASKPASKSSTLRSDYKSPLISDSEDDPDDKDGGRSTVPATLPRRGVQKPTAGAEPTTTTPLLHYNA